MDDYQTQGFEYSCDKKQQLQPHEVIFRSHVEFEKTLKEKCMECIFKNASLLQGTGATRLIPPGIWHDFTKKLETWALAQSSSSYQIWTSEEFERVFSVVQLLLGKFTKEFNFGVYGNRFNKDQETWRLLAERCPKLERFEDNRVRTKFWSVQLGVLLPDLLKLQQLQHIKIKAYECSGEELAQVLEAFPNLRSLAVSIRLQQISQDVLNKLFNLQKLEALWMGVSGTSRKDNQMTTIVNSREDLMAACLRQIPSLQEMDIFDQDIKEHVYHNSGLEVLEQPLALRTLRVKGSLRGLTCNKLPHVTKLILDHSLQDANEFLGFRNVTVVHFYKIAQGQDIMNLLRHCQFTLEELKIDHCGTADGGLDPHELFSVCSNLKVLCWVGLRCERERPELHPVNASSFKNLESVQLTFSHSFELFPSRLIMEILMAPALQNFDFGTLELAEEQIDELSGRLQQRKILQKLRKFEVAKFSDEWQTEGKFVVFCKLLVAFAPKLSLVKCKLYNSRALCPMFLNIETPGLRFNLALCGEDDWEDEFPLI